MRNKPDVLPNLYTRLFSKTGYISNSCSDGIQIPMGFFDQLEKEEAAEFVKLFESDSSTGLILTANSVKAHFNVDVNLKYSGLKNGLLSRVTNEAKLIQPTQVLLHVVKISSDDDDTVLLPEWAYNVLKINVGDPVSLCLDRNILEDQEILLNSNFVATSVTVEAMKASYIEFGVDNQSSQIDENTSIETKNALVRKNIRKSIKDYRILKVMSVISFQQGDKFYDFQIRKINNNEHQIYINTCQPQLEIELLVEDFQFTGNADLTVTMKSRQDNFNKTLVKKAESLANDGVDLDSIMRDRGLDIFFMQKAIDDHHVAKAKSKEFAQKRWKGGKRVLDAIKHFEMATDQVPTRNVEATHKHPSGPSSSIISQVKSKPQSSVSNSN